MLALHILLRGSDCYLEYRLTEAEAERFFTDLEGRSAPAAAAPDRFLRLPVLGNAYDYGRIVGATEERLRASEIVRVLVVREKGSPNG